MILQRIIKKTTKYLFKSSAKRCIGFSLVLITPALVGLRVDGKKSIEGSRYPLWMYQLILRLARNDETGCPIDLWLNYKPIDGYGFG